jgi:predicted ATPase
VLDNCEHLLDEVAAVVDAVLDAGGGARVLATSREPLRVDGEVVHRIGSLGPDAPELFVQRAVAVGGPGAATADDPRVIELCRRLDGLPLAIELTAAQLQHVTLSQLTDGFDDLLTLLVGGRPRAGERHSALTATIQWSYDLLSERSRRLFDRLGVFPAGFDLATVQAVAEEQDPVLVTTVLGDLVGKSLVVHDTESGRYRLLETIRLFASRRLSGSGVRAEVTERLRRHVRASTGAR